MPSNMTANAKHTKLLKNQSAIKCPLNAFPLKFRVQDNFYLLCLNFGISKIPTHCLKEALVT